MSGPKGMSYTVESAAQRERRLLTEATTRCRARFVQCRASSAALAQLGVTITVTSPTEFARAADADREEQRLADLAARIQREQDDELRRRREQGTRDLLLGATETTHQVASLTTKRVSTPEVSAQAAPTAEVASRQAAERAAAILSRCLVEDSALTHLARLIPHATPQRAALLLSNLDHKVERANRVELERRRLAEEEQARAREAVARAAGAASDREYVRNAVIESLQGLGYEVRATTVVDPSKVVLADPDHPGFGVRLTLGGAGELELAPVSSQPVNATTATAYEEDFCTDLPDIREELGKRGVRVDRVRRRPAGFTPVAVVPFEPRTPTPIRRAPSRRSTRAGGAS